MPGDGVQKGMNFLNKATTRHILMERNVNALFAPAVGSIMTAHRTHRMRLISYIHMHLLSIFGASIILK